MTLRPSSLTGLLLILLLPAASPALGADVAATSAAREAIRRELPAFSAMLRKTLKAGKATQRRLQKVLAAVAKLEAQLEAVERRRAHLGKSGDTGLGDEQSKGLDRKEAQVRVGLKDCAAQGAKLEPAMAAIETRLADVVASLTSKRQELLELEFALGKQDRAPLVEISKIHANVLDEDAAKPDNIGVEFEKAKVRLTRKLSVNAVAKGERWILRDTVKRWSFFLEREGEKILVYGSADKDKRDKAVTKEAKELEKLGAELDGRRTEGETNLKAIRGLITKVTELKDRHGG